MQEKDQASNWTSIEILAGSGCQTRVSMKPCEGLWMLYHDLITSADQFVYITLFLLKLLCPVEEMCGEYFLLLCVCLRSQEECVMKFEQNSCTRSLPQHTSPGQHSDLAINYKRLVIFIAVFPAAHNYNSPHKFPFLSKLLKVNHKETDS